MKKNFFLIFALFIAFSFSFLFATPKIQQLHLKEIGDMEGGCSYCHNQTTKILQKEGLKQGFLEHEKNYKKLGTFISCKTCHTVNGSVIKK